MALQRSPRRSINDLVGTEDPPGGGGAAGGSGQTQNRGSAGGNGSDTRDGSTTNRQSPKRKERANDSSKPPGKQAAGRQTGQQTGQDQPQQQRDFCQQFRDGLKRLQTGPEPAPQDYIRQYTQVLDSAVFRAIATVTEAISERGTVQLTLIDHNGFQGARTVFLHRTTAAERVRAEAIFYGPGGDPDGKNQANKKTKTQVPTPANNQNDDMAGTLYRIVRPGRIVLVPYIPRPEEHSSLFIFRRMDDVTIRAFHYANATVPLSHRPQALPNAREVFNSLRELGWVPNNGTNPTINLTLMDNMLQCNNWECGINVILNAWVYALRLQRTGASMGDRYLEFFREAAVVVNLALEGRMDSSTIEAFLKCYGFVRADSTVPEERAFDRTIPLPNDQGMFDRMARLRIQKDLNVLEAANPDPFFSYDLDAVLDTIERDPQAPRPNLTVTRAQTLVDMARQAQEAADRHDPLEWPRLHSCRLFHHVSQRLRQEEERWREQQASRKKISERNRKLKQSLETRRLWSLVQAHKIANEVCHLIVFWCDMSDRHWKF